MRNWISRLLKTRRHRQEDWTTSKSIYYLISHNIDENGRLKNEADNLPDNKDTGDESAIKFAPGLLDSMFGASDDETAQSVTDQLCDLSVRVAKTGDAKSALKFYQLATQHQGTIGIIDLFITKLATRSVPIYPHFFPFAKDLALRTNKRESVKFGIALLGLCQEKSVIPFLKILALHDEFTIYAIIAMNYLSESFTDDLLELAKKVNGWGKIQIVSRLAKMDLTPEQKDWLLREGYRNEIMNEYLAHTCAVHGQLHLRLRAESIDKELFESAGEIINALISDGPAEDISEYPFAATAIQEYIRHAIHHASNLGAFLHLTNIKRYLTTHNEELSRSTENGWTADIIANCLVDIESIINSRDWRIMVEHDIHITDRSTFWNAKQAAARLKINIRDILWSRLTKNKYDVELWYDLIHASDSTHASAIIQFALEQLPLAEIATGPAAKMGFGEQYRAHQTLDAILPFLENYPGQGEPIILAALNSPVVRNRNIALKTLQSWGRAHWSPAITNQLNELVKMEPDKLVNDRLKDLLENRPFGNSMETNN